MDTPTGRRLPFADLLGIEITNAEDGHARGHIDLSEKHSSNPNAMIAHGGVAYSLADTVGGAAAISVAEGVTPTVDMRIDYLAPATDGRIEAVAEVRRLGGSVAVVDIEVTDGDGEHVATARGTYKTGGNRSGTPWTEGRN